MSTTRAIVTACALGCLLAGCRARQAAVPVEARPDALARLAGEWTGEYSSAATGRSGSIVFTLTAGRDTAFGDVIMVPGGAERPLAAVARPGVAGQNVTGRPDTRGLTIRFVRIAGDSVSGSLDPYTAPDCDCVLTTTFTGRVHADRIDGTFTTYGGAPTGTPQRGRWAVTRRGG
jgi:hypothetical protein